ncbi:NAD(P)-binding protein [Pluteus cervinus]|uniref:NAD(P)-binding protein n=1 Tax=Pluteus cervinus TaxID=181527 RepID=A0ACD3AA35_9AGAR|nr:NAD(P)-binding protein [Pluteus cervinus]
MTTLVTGGTGKTGAPLVKKLHDAGHSVLVASRSGFAPEGVKGIKLDWTDPSTFENPFNADSNIDKIYLIPLDTTDTLTAVKPFIDLAVSKGVKRFVLLSGSPGEIGGLAAGKVHEYLDGLEGVEYAALRPTWFFENFVTSLLPSLRDEDEIVTATQDGKIPFIAVDDIADAAVHALTTPKIENTDLLILGPDLLSYDQVAEIFSSVLGRKITHRRVTVAELSDILKGYGIPNDIADMLAILDGTIAQGAEEKHLSAENKYIGKVHLADWVEQRKTLWNKA